MGSVNKVILVGNLGRDAELRYTPGGAAVATLNLATTEVWNDKGGQRQEKTGWHRIVVWGKGGKQRQVPMGEECARAVEEWRGTLTHCDDEALDTVGYSAYLAAFYRVLGTALDLIRDAEALEEEQLGVAVRRGVLRTGCRDGKQSDK